MFHFTPSWGQAILIAILVLCLYSVQSNAETILAAISRPSSGIPYDLASNLSVELSGNGTVGPYNLTDRFILVGTETVRIDSLTLERGRDYVIDYNLGQIRFAKPLGVALKATVSFRIIPFNLEHSYYHRVIAEVAISDTSQTLSHIPPSFAPNILQEESFSSLEVGGSKSFSISVGSDRDPSLEQALRLNVSGKIGKNMEVLALLSDQNTPIQPEGNTQTLEELDKVFVQVKTQNLAVSLGDFNLEYSGGEFARYERKLEGARADITTGKFRASIASAVSRGTFHTNHFNGIEGNQGPYQLLSQEGDASIVVLAGTERVWVDGILQKRGEDNNYTIEYGNGQITFTERRLITSDSRITVDFEYTNRKYKKSMTSGRAEVELLGGKLKFGSTLVREADDKNNPIDISLTTAQIESLKRAGNDPSLAWVEGVDSVGIDSTGKGMGSFIAVDGGMGGRYFSYVGPGKGIYKVSFSWVGAKQGSYEYAGGGIYTYVGAGKGSYIPGLLLPFPQKHDLGAFDFLLRPTEMLSISGEAALSDFDSNLFSSVGDNTNKGVASKVELSVLPTNVLIGRRNLGNLTASARLRQVDDRFRPLGRTEEVERDRRWGFSGAELTGERTTEFSALYNLRQASSIRAEYGRIHRKDFQSTRRDFQIGITEKSLPIIHYHSELVSSKYRLNVPQIALRKVDVPSALAEIGNVPAGDSILAEKGSGNIKRQQGDLEWTLWKLLPQIAYEDENINDRKSGQTFQGSRYKQFRGGLSTIGTGIFAFSSGYEVRYDDTFLSKWLSKSKAFTQNYKLSIRNWKSTSLSGELTHRERQFLEVEGENQKSDLGDFRVNSSPLNGAVSQELHYQLSKARTATKKRNFINVGKGKGYYTWHDRNNDGIAQEDEYVSDPNGEYILYVETIGDFRPVTDLVSQYRLNIEPDKLQARISKTKRRGSDPRSPVSGFQPPTSNFQPPTSNLLSLLRKLSTEITWEVGRKGQAENHLDFLLPWRKIFEDSTTVRDTKTFQQDIHILRDRRDFSLRFRYRKNNDLNNEFAGGKERYLSIERSLRWRFRPFKKLSFEAKYASEKKSREERELPRWNIASRAGEVESFYVPTPSVQANLKVKIGQDRESVGNIRATLLLLQPEISYALHGKGRARFALTWADVKLSPKKAPLIYQMVDGKREGRNIDWNIGLDYNLSSYITSFLTYNGRAEPGQKIRHLGQAEVRAHF